jgi:hypothetical protein
MNPRYFALVLAFLAMPFLAGCAQSGLFASANLTEVQLNQANYQIVATDVSGQSEAGYLLGLSFSSGVSTQTLALWRVNGTGYLYKEALADLWANFTAEHGEITGRKLALINVRYDSDHLNLLVYAKPKLSIRADIVEFVD